jgi:hypothetical protein
MAGLDFSEAIRRLRTSMDIIPCLAEAIRGHNLEKAAAYVGRIAHEESQAYTELSNVVGEPNRQMN